MENKRHLASTTGLYAFDVFEVLLSYEIARVKRYPSPISLVHLTLISEDVTVEFRRQAHEAMTSLLDRTLRISDVPAHYQDDFLVLLPATDEMGCRAVAERILASYRTTRSLSTGRLSNKRNAYVGLTTQNSGSVLSSGQLLAEAATAMSEARARHSYTYIAYSDLMNQAAKE